jgi:2'-deoxynucleoside 5'-phosphate N-hydrolase
MKIFFSHRMLQNSETTHLYEQIVSLLGEYGEVLTENSNDGIEPSYVFERDTDWLREADVVVAEVTTPSLGVGYEIGLAESLEKRILCLYREQEDSHVSAMIIAQYESITDIENYLVDYF